MWCKVGHVTRREGAPDQESYITKYTLVYEDKTPPTTPSFSNEWAVSFGSGSVNFGAGAAFSRKKTALKLFDWDHPVNFGGETDLFGPFGGKADIRVYY